MNTPVKPPTDLATTPDEMCPQTYKGGQLQWYGVRCQRLSGHERNHYDARVGYWGRALDE